MSTERSRRWRPSPLVALSLAATAAAPIAVAAFPAYWRWIVGTVLADHALVATAGMLPRSRVLGPNLRRLPGERPSVALTFDDGPDPEGTPRVLDALDRVGARATFFVVGKRAQRFPEWVAEIAARGHQLANHSWSHANTFGFAGPRRLAREIGRVQTLIVELGRPAPRWFRPPAGIRGPFLDPLLHRHSLGLVSWTGRGFDAVDSDPERVLVRLLRRTGPGAILLLHDGRTPRRTVPEGPLPAGVAALPRLLDELEARGLATASLPGETAFD